MLEQTLDQRIEQIAPSRPVYYGEEMVAGEPNPDYIDEFGLFGDRRPTSTAR